MDLQEVLSGYDWRKLKAIASEYGIEKPEGGEWVDLVPNLVEAIREAGKTEEFFGAASVTPEANTQAAEHSLKPSSNTGAKPSDYYQKIGVPLGEDGDKVRFDRHGNRLN